MKLKFGFVETALPRMKKNAKPAICGVRAGEPVSAAEESCCFWHQHSPAARLLIASEPPKRAATAENDPARLH